eukprot:SAG22_NODE_21_length_31784_cov_15.522897_10_plen_159_part_00
MDVEFSGRMTFANLKAIKTNLGRRLLTTNYIRAAYGVNQWDLCAFGQEDPPCLCCPVPVEMLDEDVPAHLTDFGNFEPDYVDDDDRESKRGYDYLEVFEGDDDMEALNKIPSSEWKLRKATKEDWIDRLSDEADIVTKANGKRGVDVSYSISEYAVKS